MKYMMPCLFIVILLFSGCRETGNAALRSSDPVDDVSGSIYQNVQSDIVIRIMSDTITTKTDTIDLEFINQTDQELTYSDQAILLERKEENGRISVVGRYGQGHEIATALEANGTNKKTIQITRLEVGTYRFVFLQGYSTPEGPVYISSDFQVSE